MGRQPGGLRGHAADRPRCLKQAAGHACAATGHGCAHRSGGSACRRPRRPQLTLSDCPAPVRARTVVRRTSWPHELAGRRQRDHRPARAAVGPGLPRGEGPGNGTILAGTKPPDVARMPRPARPGPVGRRPRGRRPAGRHPPGMARPVRARRAVARPGRHPLGTAMTSTITESIKKAGGCRLLVSRRDRRPVRRRL